MKPSHRQYDLQSRCICKVCSNTLTLRIEQQPQQQTTNDGGQTLMHHSYPPTEDSIINQPTAASSPTYSANTTAHQANASVQPNNQVLVITPQQQQPQPQQPHQYQHHQVPIQQHPSVPIPHLTPMMGMGYYTHVPTFFSPYQPWLAATNPFTSHTPHIPVF